jgi:hypothetical protein
MSKQFERLYHAWVLEFRERYLRWADPRARPWEHSCRKHDGKCGTPDDQMVLCDHCDAMYGFKCVDPPLKKTPKKAWHCPDCKPKLKSIKGTRMLSAVAENAARKRAELGDIPKKKSKQTMYLVKWAGLGYEYCTWETREDINSDEVIADFHQLNRGFSDEFDMEEKVVDEFLEKIEHVSESNAGGIACIPTLRSQLYAQSRALQFVKFGMDLPDALGTTCGPCTNATIHCTPNREDRSLMHPQEVVSCVADLVFRTAMKLPRRVKRSNTALPPLLLGEYDTIIPVTAKGLMMNVGEVHNSVAFLGYRKFPDGRRGPAEIANLVRGVGDVIIAVDGVSTIGKSFKDVIAMLRESGENKFAYMRFLESRFKACDKELLSLGTKGKYTIEELQKKFSRDRQRMVVQRAHQLIEAEEEEEVVKEDDEDADEEDDDDSDDGSEAEFQPDSEDEEMADKAQASVQPNEPSSHDPSTALGELQASGATATSPASGDALPPTEQDNVTSDPVEQQEARQNGILVRPETTRSLTYRLLDIDLGYSSDEGGDEDAAYFIDGVDSTFTNMADLPEVTPTVKTEEEKDASEPTIPARQNEFSTQGERAKLAAAVALTSKVPDCDDFDNFPNRSSKSIEAEQQKLEEAAEDDASPAKTKRSTVKLEQVDATTGEVIHIWANVEAAAATLQLSLNQLRQVLRGEYDEDVGEEVGGYKWRFALAGAKPTAGIAPASRTAGSKKAKEAWLEFRDKLYDPAEPHNYKNGNRLRDYQVDGVNWLASTWYKRQGAILADEMVCRCVQLLLSICIRYSHRLLLLSVIIRVSARLYK